MSNLSESLTDIAKLIKKRCTAKAIAAASLQGALERAIVILEADAAFSDDETIIDMFMDDGEIARVYVTLQTSHACVRLLTHKLADRKSVV